MPVMTSRETAAKTAKRYEGTGGYKWRTRTMYMGVGKEQARGNPDPQAFLVRIEPPGGSIRPHFHESKQFQVFVDGNGTLAKHESLEPVVVHYSDAFTTYGPIVTEEHGSSFFTLRHKHDSGARYMPDSRDKIKGIPGKPGRNRAARVPESFTQTSSFAPGEVRSAEIITPEADGLATWVYGGGRDATITGPEPSGGDGAYWLVLAGSFICGGQQLSRHSLVYVGPTEPPLEGTCGPDGAALLCMQFGELDIMRGG